MDMSLRHSRRWCRTGKPGMLQSIGLQRVRYDWLSNILRYYLCDKRHKPLTVQYYITDCVSWVHRLTLLDLQTNWTYEYSCVGVVVIQPLSHVRLFATPWTAACQASLSFTISQSLCSVSIESVMPSNHLILCHPLFLLPPIPPSIRVFSNGSTLRMRWPKYRSFSFSIIPSKEHSGPISFRMDWLDLLAVSRDSQESSPTPQFKSINSSALSLLHSPTLTSIHDHRKNHSLD